MLLFCSHLQATQYYLGDYLGELRGERFHPEIHGRMSWEGGQLGGARTLLDGSGRRIFFDWVREIRGAERERAAGWSGVMTLPRILGLDAGGTLTIEPVPEVAMLRYRHRRRQQLTVAAGADPVVNGIAGDTLELGLEIDPAGAHEVGVAVRCSPDGAEQTPVVYDARAGVIRVDVSRSSLDREIVYHRYRPSSNGQALLATLPERERTVAAQEAPFTLAAGEPLELRLFLDRSLLEVYVNGRQCVTQRIYPTRADATGIRLLARGGAATVRRLDAWELAPAHV
jgi:beta-fructofuranosidase